MPTRPADAATARKFGAEGIGLCRTEHMFFEADRIIAVRQMILADDGKGAQSRAGQTAADAARRFRGHLQGDGGPAGHHPAARSAAARIPAAQGRRRSRKWPRAAGTDRAKNCAPAPSPCMNPIPCWAIAAAGWASPIPEIYEMQARAILEAALPMWRRRAASRSQLEIMIPLVGFKSELDRLAARIAQRGRGRSRQERGKVPDYMIGTMIELPRAALRAGEIAADGANSSPSAPTISPRPPWACRATMPACS